MRAFHAFIFFAVTGFSGAAWSADLELGEYLAQSCLGCHQAKEIVGTIPIIHGLDEEYFIEAMYDYRDGFRENNVMMSVASSLSDEDVEALAAWFAIQEDLSSQ
jgi:Cytochrome c553